MNTVDVESLYRDHGHIVLRRACAILGNMEDAREVLQDLFVSLVQDPRRFRQESSPVTFLYAATTHRALRRLRDQKNRGRLLDEQVKPTLETSHPASGEQLAILRDVLRRLPEDLAIVAVYAYMDGLSQDEIAGIIGCSRRQVGKMLEKFHARADVVTHLVPLRARYATTGAADA